MISRESIFLSRPLPGWLWRSYVKIIQVNASSPHVQLLDNNFGCEQSAVVQFYSTGVGATISSVVAIKLVLVSQLCCFVVTIYPQT